MRDFRTWAGVLIKAAGLSLLLASQAWAQGRDCCSVSDNTFYAAGSSSACEAAGDIPATTRDPSKMASLQACYQNVMQEAQDAYGGAIPGLPPGVSIPGMPQQATPVAGETQYQCCNTDSGSFAGLMTAQACRQQGENYAPDLPENLTQTEICRRAGSGGGGGGSAWNVEDYEPNIENGGVETWASDRRPRNFTTFGVNPDISRDYPIDIQVAFRSSDAHTGDYSVRIKNLDLAPQLPPEARQVTALLGEGALVTPGGVTTCKEPCPAESASSVENSASEALRIFAPLKSDDVKSHVCGAYKGFIAASDELVVSVSVNGGDTLSAGTQESFTRSSSDWIEFSMPMSAWKGEIPSSANVGIGARIMARGNQMAWGKSPLTEIWIDSIHFCDPMQLIAFAPEVIAGDTTTKIPEREEDSKGVQTFVNLDNDDEDAAFDNQDDDGVSGDDELVRLRLELPMNSFGKVSFNTSGVGEDIALWDDENKTRPFTLFNDEYEVEEVLRATGDGQKFVREIWVEALTPSASPGDRVFEFIFKNRRNNDREERDKVVLTALGLQSLEWVGKSNSKDDSDTFDEDPNWPASADGKAYRVFPGKRWSGDAPEANPRKEVTLKATLNVAPPRPVKLYFRAFDIDDPSAEDDEVDREDSAEDNRGDTPNKWGFFSGVGGEIRELEMDAQTGEFGFQVTMQPGDNFRIAGGADRDFLQQLENDDGKLSKIAPVHTTKIVEKNIFEKTESPGEARIQSHEMYETPALTVWRRMYVEIDTMDAVQGNEVSSIIADFRGGDDMTSPTGVPWTQQCITLNVNLYNELPDESKSGPAGYANNYVKGKLTLDGQDYSITAQSNRSGENDEVCIAYPKKWGPLTEADKNKKITLRDDDLKKNGDALDTLPTAEVAPAFAPAYVLPDFDAAPNPSKIATFRLHFKADDSQYLKSVFAENFDNKNYSSDSSFWVVYLLNAFQGKLNEDADGEAGGLSGQADGPGGYGAAIYQESGRETGDAYTANNTATGWQLKDAPPHEIGHLFGALHEDGGIMSYDAKKTMDFEPITLDKIRSASGP